MKLWRVGVSAVGMLAVVGCVGGEVAPSVSPNAVPSVSTSSTPTPSVIPTPTPSPTPTPTPTPTSFESYLGELPTEDAESAAIFAGWQEYQRVLWMFAADPLGYTDFSETQYVTWDDKQNGILDDLSLYRESKIKVLGDFSYTQFVLHAPTERADGLKAANLDYCVDRSLMKVVDYDGVDVTNKDLTPTFPESAVLVEGPDGTWRVSAVTNDPELPC